MSKDKDLAKFESEVLGSILVSIGDQEELGVGVKYMEMVLRQAFLKSMGPDYVNKVHEAVRTLDQELNMPQDRKEPIMVPLHGYVADLIREGAREMTDELDRNMSDNVLRFPRK